MEIVSQELGTLVASMTIENGIVAAGDLGMQLQVLQALIRVFHTFSLTYVTDDACVVSLNLKL